MAASRAFKAKELVGDVDLKVGKEVVGLTNLDKIYWPDDGYTKGDLFEPVLKLKQRLGPEDALWRV